MKIAFDHQIFMQQQYGGISRYFAGIGAELAQMPGNDVRYVAPLHINAYLDALPRALVVGHRIAQSPWRRRLMRPFDRFAVPLALRAFGPDIVHETYYANFRTAPKSARIVLTVYDMIHELFQASFAPDDRTAARKAAALARADHVLCISQSTRRDLLAAHPQVADKTSVTLLGFDPPPSLPVPRDGVAAAPYLLFVGGRLGYKNFSGLLEAYAASPALRAEFTVVAAGGGAFTVDEQALIARLGIGGRVRHAAADDATLQRLYAYAAVFVYPSLYEGFGIPPLEAMAAGAPVVAMHASSVPEVCADAAQYAQPDSTESLRAAIEAVALSPTRAAQLRAAGSARLAHFSWHKCAVETAAAYRSLL